ncbi:sodium:solute symporter [Peijinzhouia sedimentorum]
MNPLVTLSILAAYFGVLLLISYFTGKGATNLTFFTANRQSPWYLVAYGMIGASLSGVTFISVPGEVGATAFSYFQVVLGYMVGYFVIATVLMPLYYRMNTLTIYGYLEQRFGFWAYKTGAFFFILSRVVGSSFRLFLVASVLQLAVFNAWEVPFWVSVLVTVILIWLYTFRGGIKTIVWTDTLQTTFMLLAVLASIRLISNELDFSFTEMISSVRESEYSQIFFWDWKDGKSFFKQFTSGAFIAIVMTGLDQDMMQKNLTCRNLKDAQKNIFWFSLTLIIVNLFFLVLGVLLYQYAFAKGIDIPLRTDNLYPMLALDYFPTAIGILFLLGITAAAYSSADSAMTALTTSFCVDILGLDGKENENAGQKTRMKVHVGFTIVIFAVIILFEIMNDESVINSIFKAAGYTYGPLLGLYSFGLMMKRNIKDKWVPLVCIISPIMSFIINLNSVEWLNGYQFGFEILILNGLLTFIGLLFISKKAGG